MRSVALEALRKNLGHYVELAQAGETVLVTDQDRVVAELVPPRAEPTPLTDDEFLARGVREGWLTPARVRGPWQPRPGTAVTTLPELLDELARDREDR